MTQEIIECRNPQQIAEDELVQAHTDLQQSLAVWDAPSGRYLHVGERRRRMTALLTKLENKIAAGDSSRESSVSWPMYVWHTTYGKL